MHWKCAVCGYLHPEAEAPARCPVCGAPVGRFSAIDPTIAIAAGDRATDAPAGSESKKSIAPASVNLQWRCTVCGYIHTGPEPPEVCPVCGADRSKFVQVTEKKDSPVSPVTPPVSKLGKRPSSDPSDEAKPKTATTGNQWRCSVCSHIHDGDFPPDACPVCGSPREKFKASNIKKKVMPAAPSAPSWVPQKYADAYSKLSQVLSRYHAHPIAVHLPNGVAPIATLFLILALLTHSQSLERAAFYNMIVVMLAMPVVLFTGYLDWKGRYGGRMSRVFRTKIICGIIVTVLAVILVFWRMLDPAVAFSGAGVRTLYLFAYLALVAAGGVAGFNGGKLVFPKK